MSDFPAHASPVLPPITSPRPEHPERTFSQLKLDHDHEHTNTRPHPPILTPAFTPPATPGNFPLDHASSVTSHEPTEHPSAAVRTQATQQPEQPPPQLLEVLPEVTCEVRARIPTTSGQQMWLHLYHNNVDNKEHLAIVFGPHIRSRSLDAFRPGETEKDRMIRGAYTGTLYPGRTSSRVDQIRREAGVTGGGGGSPASAAGAESNDAKHEQTDKDATSYPTTAAAQLLVEEEERLRHLSAPLVRIHSECYTGETVWSARCDCGEQLDEAARLMSLPPTPSGTGPTSSSGGVIIYLRQEGRGIGLLSKLKAYNLQDLGHDTMQANLLLRHPADARSYGLATAMLLDLGLGGDRGIRLLTNNPEKVRAVEGPNREVQVVERVAMIPLSWKSGGKEGVRGPEVEKYISTKIEKFKHMFSS